MAMSAGPHHDFNDAISFMVSCASQAEVDKYWDAILKNGGKPQACGWIIDKYGVRWQITPTVLIEMMTSPDKTKAPARRRRDDEAGEARHRKARSGVQRPLKDTAWRGFRGRTTPSSLTPPPLAANDCARNQADEGDVMRSKWIVPAFLLMGLAAVSAMVPAASSGEKGSAGQCTDAKSGKSVDCVPTTYATFDIPFDKLPGGRMNAQGELDPKSSPADAHKGAFVAAKKLGLFRNFEWVHWVPTAPSKQDPATGKWSGGDLDGFPTGWGSTGLGIAGDCLYWGRSNSTNTTGPGVTRDIKIFKIQKKPGEERARRSRHHAAADCGQRQDRRARSRAAPVQLQVHGWRRPHAHGPQRRDRHRR